MEKTFLTASLLGDSGLFRRIYLLVIFFRHFQCAQPYLAREIVVKWLPLTARQKFRKPGKIF